MHVLLIGSGGREHALAAAIRRSPLTSRLTAAPGNAGIADLADIATLDVTDHQAVIAFCKAQDVGLVVVGPEAPLVAGLADDLEAAGVPVFGPGREAARLEGSKAFTKALCDEAGIPTAAYGRFDAAGPARDYVTAKGAPIVVKADGLASGKGVVVAATVEEALAAVDACFSGAFGEAGAEVVIEECLVGEEASFFAISDGIRVVPLAAAQDHKRVGGRRHRAEHGRYGRLFADACGGRGDGRPDHGRDRRAHRGDAGAAGHTVQGRAVRRSDDRRRGAEADRIQRPLRRPGDGGGTAAPSERPRGPHAGGGQGRPRCTPRGLLAGDGADGGDGHEGYPGPVAKGSRIAGLERAAALPGVSVFHAGTARRDGALVAAGGRVLAVTAMGGTVAEAQARATRRWTRSTGPRASAGATSAGAPS